MSRIDRIDRLADRVDCTSVKLLDNLDEGLMAELYHIL